MTNVSPPPDQTPGDLIRPEIYPVSVADALVSSGVQFREILQMLHKGRNICLTGTYAFALSFYSWLRQQNSKHNPATDYSSSRTNREAFRLFNTKLFIRILHHAVNLVKAPSNPWLKTFYAGQDDFLMRFSDFLGMNGAWQWYRRGIRFPTLDDLVHPFYGVYFPTRHEHLLLFEKWLSSNHSFERGIDIGTGCGVLALMMLKHGIPFVHATDINPNAVYSAGSEIQKRNLSGRCVIERAALSGSFEPGKNDLVVFNPPWIPEPPETSLDAATYYEPNFFESFFEHSHQKFEPKTTLVLLFSNFARVAGLSKSHPIEQELQQQKRFVLVEQFSRPVYQAPSDRKNWLAAIREKERVELWVLQNN